MTHPKKLENHHSGGARDLASVGHLAKLPIMRKLDEQTKRRLEAQARVIKALAQPTRLFLIEELCREERCVCELAEMVGADVSTVSKHLTLLREAGIVASDKRGKRVFYRMQVGCALDFTSCASAVLEETSRRQLAAAV
jgi:DNA-binding transcriptional ArsR family regulator